MQTAALYAHTHALEGHELVRCAALEREQLLLGGLVNGERSVRTCGLAKANEGCASVLSSGQADKLDVFNVSERLESGLQLAGFGIERNVPYEERPIPTDVETRFSALLPLLLNVGPVILTYELCLFFLSYHWLIFGKLREVRSRLYQRNNLQINTKY